jgi:hypothetical protein
MTVYERVLDVVQACELWSDLAKQLRLFTS